MIIVFWVVFSTLVVAPLAVNPTQASGNTQVWIGPDNQPLPFQTHEEILEFLRPAEVVSIEDIPVGVTKPRKVLAIGVSLITNMYFADFSTVRWLSLFTLAIVTIWIVAARYAGKQFRALTEGDR